MDWTYRIQIELHTSLICLNLNSVLLKIWIHPKSALGFKIWISDPKENCPYPTNLNWNLLKIRVRIIFSNYSYTSGIKRFRLDFIIIVLLSAQVEKDDSLPQSVCLTCLESTAQFLAFRETCHQTQVTLKRQLSSPVSSVSLPLLQSCF